MGLMAIGLLLWIAAHWVPALAVPWRASLIERWGLKRYRAGFSLLIVLALLLIVLGWRSSTPVFLYALPEGTRHLAMLLVWLGFLLFGMKAYPSRLKRVIRHPQLTGVALWALAHLSVNGDSRSLLLFGSLGAWAILSMILINRREGAWQKPEAGSWFRELRGALISTVIFILVAGFLHPYIAGVPVFYR